MPLSLATFRDQSNLEHNSLFIGAMAACSLVLNSFPDTIIRMVVAFVAGEPSRDDVFLLWRHPRKLVPLSRRFVPEPVEMTYIVTDTLFAETFDLGLAAGIPSEVGIFISRYADGIPSEIRNMRMACGDERICSICWYGAAEIHPVRQVTLQTRLRRPFWPNTEAFRVFVRDRIVRVDMHVCINCVVRSGLMYNPFV